MKYLEAPAFVPQRLASEVDEYFQAEHYVIFTSQSTLLHVQNFINVSNPNDNLFSILTLVLIDDIGMHTLWRYESRTRAHFLTDEIAFSSPSTSNFFVPFITVSEDLIYVIRPTSYSDSELATTAILLIHTCSSIPPPQVSPLSHHVAIIENAKPRWEQTTFASFRVDIALDGGQPYRLTGVPSRAQLRNLLPGKTYTISAIALSSTAMAVGSTLNTTFVMPITPKSPPPGLVFVLGELVISRSRSTVDQPSSQLPLYVAISEDYRVVQTLRTRICKNMSNSLDHSCHIASIRESSSGESSSFQNEYTRGQAAGSVSHVRRNYHQDSNAVIIVSVSSPQSDISVVSAGLVAGLASASDGSWANEFNLGNVVGTAYSTNPTFIFPDDSTPTSATSTTEPLTTTSTERIDLIIIISAVLGTLAVGLLVIVILFWAKSCIHKTDDSEKFFVENGLYFIHVDVWVTCLARQP